jgi:hypothetical protein
LCQEIGDPGFDWLAAIEMEGASLCGSVRGVGENSKRQQTHDLSILRALTAGLAVCGEVTSPRSETHRANGRKRFHIQTPLELDVIWSANPWDGLGQFQVCDASGNLRVN